MPVFAFGAFGFSDFRFDIGGKKSRRRYATATSPEGESCSISIKSTVLWVGMADVVRFPWSKRAAHGDDLRAVLCTADDAIRRSGTHLLAIVGNAFAGTLTVARLYTLDEVRQVAAEQQALCRYPFYVAHGAALIIRSHDKAFTEAETAALAAGDDILAPQPVTRTRGPPGGTRSGPIYRRDTKVRDAALKLTDGCCERCGQQGFLAITGERYLETHHVVGIAERGSDTIDNIIAVCPHCQRQAYIAADRVSVERDFMLAIRRRGSRWRNQKE